MPQTLLSKNYNLEQIPEIARQIASLLSNHKGAFCVALEGPLAAGKTTLVGFILKALELPGHQAVASPTFAYIHEYQIKDRWFAHLDLYRLDFPVNLDERGILNPSRNYAGYFVEWADRLGTVEPPITHRIELQWIDDKARAIHFSKFP